MRGTAHVAVESPSGQPESFRDGCDAFKDAKLRWPSVRSLDRPPCSPGKPTRSPGTQKPSQFRSDSAACRGLRTEFRPFSRVLRLKSPASLSPQNSVSRTTRWRGRSQGFVSVRSAGGGRAGRQAGRGQARGRQARSRAGGTRSPVLRHHRGDRQRHHAPKRKNGVWRQCVQTRRHLLFELLRTAFWAGRRSERPINSRALAGVQSTSTVTFLPASNPVSFDVRRGLAAPHPT